MYPLSFHLISGRHCYGLAIATTNVCVAKGKQSIHFLLHIAFAVSSRAFVVMKREVISNASKIQQFLANAPRHEVVCCDTMSCSFQIADTNVDGCNEYTN